jgi:hypothetical protein
VNIEPERIVAILRQRLGAQTSPIAGYWLVVSDARHDFCSRVTEHAGGEPIVPLVVTGAAFQFPNEMAIDFVKLVDANRAAFSDVIDRLGAVPRAGLFCSSAAPHLTCHSAFRRLLCPNGCRRLEAQQFKFHLKT